MELKKGKVFQDILQEKSSEKENKMQSVQLKDTHILEETVKPNDLYETFYLYY